jgi:hypothetical protein
MVYEHISGTGYDLGWMMTGLSIRLIQGKGVHRRFIMNETSTRMEGELWKRVFWVLVFFDVKMSMIYGRPRAISVQE